MENYKKNIILDALKWKRKSLKDTYNMTNRADNIGNFDCFDPTVKNNIKIRIDRIQEIIDELDDEV